MRITSAPEFVNTLYTQTVGSASSASGFVERVGSFLFLYAGALTAGTVALIGVRCQDRRWVAPALTAGVAAWSLAWIGVLLHYLAVTDRWTLLFGYWWVMVSLVFAMVGAIIALWSSRRSAGAVEGPRLTP